MSNPYQKFVSEFVQAAEAAKSIPLGGLPPPPRPQVPPAAPKALLFAPHPDDECIVGALPLRLLREQKMNVISVAVTQGSRTDRQAARFAEFTDACRYVGFGVIQTQAGGLEKVNVKTRNGDPAAWEKSVGVIARIISENRPRVVFIPHESDWNSTHIGTHFLVMDALKKIGDGFRCHLVETEYWQAMATPNLMVECSAADLADLIAALSLHVGEVQRNPYHLSLPAWMADNVRRGGELVGGQGAAVPDYPFATLYRVKTWTGSRAETAYEGGKLISRGDDLGALFASQA